MQNIRSLITFSFICLGVLFNIERLDIYTQNAIDINSFVYIQSLIAVITIILIPAFQRLNTGIVIIMWICVYFLIKFFLGEEPILGGSYTYLSVTEVSLLTILIWISHRITLEILNFEEAVENITFKQSNQRVHDLDKSGDEIQNEMFRSRHYNRPLSLIMIEPDPESIQETIHQKVREVQQAMMKSYVINNTAQMLSKYLRRTDLVLEQRSEGRFVVLCPETNIDDCQSLMEHIRTITTEQLGISVTCSVASFPDDALTFEELVNHAASRLT